MPWSSPVKSEPKLEAQILDTSDELARWLLIAEDSTEADLRQCPWWSEPLRPYGVQTQVLGVCRGKEIVCGGLFRIIPAIIPGFRTAECLDGPLFLDGDTACARSFVDGLRRLASRARVIEATIAGCRQTEVHDALFEGLRRSPGAVRNTPDHSHAVIPLAGRTWTAIRAKFNRRTRTALLKAADNGLTVRRLQTDEELHQAHGAWLASATRKNFTEVRPWKALQPVLRQCVDRSLGYVIASYADGQMLGSIFFTCFGRAGRCIYAGHYDRARPLFGNHVLQATAIQICMERNLATYDLDVLSLDYDASPDGVDEYKLGFGTTPVPAPEKIVWERRPILCRLVNLLRQQTLVKGALKAVRRRLMRQGA